MQVERLVYRAAPPVLRLLLRPRVDGLENVPRTGPLIVAANHLSFVDSLVIPLVMPRRVTFLAKAEYFEGRGFGPWFLASMGYTPIRRGVGHSALVALDQALETLEAGGAFVIYPEGTRSEDGRLYRGRTGVGHLALMSGAAVLPVGLVGTDRVQPVGARLPRPGRRVAVHIGKPLTFPQYVGQPPARARRAIADDVMAAIRELSGQDYAGVYNPRSSSA